MFLSIRIVRVFLSTIYRSIHLFDSLSILLPYDSQHTRNPAVHGNVSHSTDGHHVQRMLHHQMLCRTLCIQSILGATKTVHYCFTTLFAYYSKLLSNAVIRLIPQGTVDNNLGPDR